jgi:hypothetical protein
MGPPEPPTRQTADGYRAELQRYGPIVHGASLVFFFLGSVTELQQTPMAGQGKVFPNKRRLEMKRFASLALASALAVTALSPAEAYRHRPHFIFARLGAGVCDGLVCTGAFFATPADACGLVFVPSTTRFVRPVSRAVCPSGLGVTMYQMVR